METAQINEHLARERERAADMLRELTPEQWEAQSLCEGWKVRDVAAHMSSLARMDNRTAAIGIAKSFGNFNRYIAEEARSHAAAHEPGELIAELRLAANNTHRPPMSSELDPLVDVIMHSLDITAAVGIDWEVPTDAATTAADHLTTRKSMIFFGGRRLRGLHLEATNAPWSHGDGPDVRGRIEDLLLLLAGRQVPLTHFEGDGVDVLRERGV